MNELKICRLKKSEIILDRVSNYIELLSNKDIEKFIGIKAGMKLYSNLIGPVKDKLKNIKKIIIIPDRNLHYLPFESLVIEEFSGKVRYLIEGFCISYAPSISSLINLLSRKKPSKREVKFLGFADPVYLKNKFLNNELNIGGGDRGFSTRKGLSFERLPFSNTELKKISEYFPEKLRKMYVRENASEEILKKINLAEYRIIHFAMHGFFDEIVPARSALVFTLNKDTREDGFVQIREIYNLKLNADLVVLSACKTGRGKLDKGEGVTGLYRAFLNAGARTVLMSLWNINDKVTSEFMILFYENLINGSSKEVAL
jgi:CHAT domain-containing protein